LRRALWARNTRDYSRLPASVQLPHLGDELLAVLVVSDADVRTVALVVEEEEHCHPLADVGEDLAGCGSYCTGHCRFRIVVGVSNAMNEMVAAASDAETMLRGVVLGDGREKSRRGALRGASSF
jgi:hypothetical protein